MKLLGTGPATRLFGNPCFLFPTKSHRGLKFKWLMNQDEQVGS